MAPLLLGCLEDIRGFDWVELAGGEVADRGAVDHDSWWYREAFWTAVRRLTSDRQGATAVVFEQQQL